MRAELWDLLAAIAEGLVTRDSPAYNARYVGPDAEVSYQEIYLLDRWGLIEKHISGPPQITPEGRRALAERR